MSQCSGHAAWWHARVQVLTSELFGLSHFASNHSVMHVAPTLGGLILSATLAGNLWAFPPPLEHLELAPGATCLSWRQLLLILSNTRAPLVLRLCVQEGGGSMECHWWSGTGMSGRERRMATPVALASGATATGVC